MKKFKKIHKKFLIGGVINPTTISNLTNLLGGLSNLGNPNSSNLGATANNQANNLSNVSTANNQANNLGSIANIANMGSNMLLDIANNQINKYTNVEKSPAIEEYNQKLAMLNVAQKGNLLSGSLKNHEYLQNFLDKARNNFLVNPQNKDKEEDNQLGLQELEETQKVQNQGYIPYYLKQKNENISKNNTKVNNTEVNNTEVNNEDVLQQLEETQRIQNQGYIPYYLEQKNKNISKNNTEENTETENTEIESNSNIFSSEKPIFNNSNKFNISSSYFPLFLKKKYDINNSNTNNTEEDNSLDAEAKQKIGIFGEGILNTGLAIKNAIQANKAFREYTKLKTPKIDIPTTVRGATKQDLTEAKKEISGNTQRNLDIIKGNTGNLQSLLSGITNLNKQKLDTFTNLENQNNALFKQDEQRRDASLSNIAEKQNLYNYEHNLKETERKRQMYKDAMKLANASHQTSIQNLLAINKNLTDLNYEKEKDLDKLEITEGAFRNQAINELKKDRRYYYKLDANGNILKDANGDFVNTTEEEKRKLEEDALKDFIQSNKYESLIKLRNDIKERGRIFNRKKTEVKAQKGRKMIKESDNVLNKIINNFVNLTHKNTLLELQKNSQLYNSSKDAVNQLRMLQIKTR